VLWEWLNYFSLPARRRRAYQGYLRLHSDRLTEVIDFEPSLGEAAVEMYGARADKEWGVIDCLSFVVMKQRALEAALTFDHHFEQAGFAALLLHPPPQE
jgi:predicted nucleic acid-binding protein